MILKGACNNGRLAHNGSFIIILALGDEEVGIKLQWGDFGEDDVPDMRIEVDAETGNLLRSVSWTVQTENNTSSWNGKAYPVKNVATVPPGTEVFVLGEQDSYWKAKNNGGLLKSTGKPADDPHSQSGYRHFLPEETTVFIANYVRAFARGIWKDGVYTPFSYESERPRHLAWLKGQAELPLQFYSVTCLKGHDWSVREDSELGKRCIQRKEKGLEALPVDCSECEDCMSEEY